MWTSTSMTIPESLLVSLMGFSIVFGMLVFLALVILVFSKVFPALAKKSETAAAPKAAPAAPKAAPAAPAPAPVVDDKSETLAILTAVICEEMGADPNELNIRSVAEL